MGRLVEPREAGSKLYTGGAADDYLARVAKYIPAEFVAIYLTLDKITKPDGAWTSLDHGLKNEAILEGGFVFVILLCLNIVYLAWRGLREKKPYKLQTGISSAAFVLWAFALPGTLFMGIYSAKWSSIILILFSFAAGLFEPTKPGTRAPGKRAAQVSGSH